MMHVVGLDPSPRDPNQLMDKIKSITSIVVFVSKSPVGSSSNKISGSFANERAIATLCCSPPDKSLGR